MTNFIFKSVADLQKIRQQIEVVLAEQRNQRSDLALLIQMTSKLINAMNLEAQVKEYHQERIDDDDNGN